MKFNNDPKRLKRLADAEDKIEPLAQSCKDCDEAAKLAYSDATTPGFFSPQCGKHRTGAPRVTPRVTPLMAREAYFKLHNHVYNGAPIPLLTIPRRNEDIDCTICDFINQYESLEAERDALQKRMRELEGVINSRRRRM